MISRNASGILLQRGSLARRTVVLGFPHEKAPSSFAAHHVRRVQHRSFQTWQTQAYAKTKMQIEEEPGSKAFAECETDAIKDLFHEFAKTDGSEGIKCLDHDGVRELLKSIGERPDERTLRRMFKAADFNGDGVIELHVCAETLWTFDRS